MSCSDGYLGFQGPCVFHHLLGPPSEGQPGVAAPVFAPDASCATVITGLQPNRAGPSGRPCLTVRTLVPMVTQGPADERACF